MFMPNARALAKNPYKKSRGGAELQMKRIKAGVQSVHGHDHDDLVEIFHFPAGGKMQIFLKPGPSSENKINIRN